MAEMNHAALAESMSEGARLDAELADLASGDSGPAALAGGNPVQLVCALWQRIRGAVTWVSKFPLIPGNIRAVLQQLIELLDGLCAG